MGEVTWTWWRWTVPRSKISLRSSFLHISHIVHLLVVTRANARSSIRWANRRLENNCGVPGLRFPVAEGRHAAVKWRLYHSKSTLREATSLVSFGKKWLWSKTPLRTAL